MLTFSSKQNPSKDAKLSLNSRAKKFEPDSACGGGSINMPETSLLAPQSIDGVESGGSPRRKVAEHYTNPS